MRVSTEMPKKRCMEGFEDYGKGFGLLGLSHTRVCTFMGM